MVVDSSDASDTVSKRGIEGRIAALARELVAVSLAMKKSKRRDEFCRYEPLCDFLNGFRLEPDEIDRFEPAALLALMLSGSAVRRRGGSLARRGQRVTLSKLQAVWDRVQSESTAGPSYDPNAEERLAALEKFIRDSRSVYLTTVEEVADDGHPGVTIYATVGTADGGRRCVQADSLEKFIDRLAEAEKGCPACKTVKPVSAFTVDCAAPGGYAVVCRVCVNAKRRAVKRLISSQPSDN